MYAKIDFEDRKIDHKAQKIQKAKKGETFDYLFEIHFGRVERL